MVDYSTPFASGGVRREPTDFEIDNGFVCGGAPRDLFNWLEYATQSEIGEVLAFAGINQSNSDLTQLRQAIQKLIDTAISQISFESPGGPIDTSGFLLMAQARARLPVYPLVQTASGKLAMTTGSGKVLLTAGQTFLHRGIFQVTTTAEEFPHSASKIYHVRWRRDTGYAILDLSNLGYNPSSLAETSPAFDSTYDDMLIARVITDGSNAATITTLKNVPQLAAELYVESDVNDSVDYTTLANSGLELNWARTPTICSLRMLLARAKNGAVDGTRMGAFDGNLKMIGVEPVAPATRYSTGNAKYAFEDSAASGGRIGFSWAATAR